MTNSPIIYDQYNYAPLVGNGSIVLAGGEHRMLSHLPPDSGYNSRKCSRSFSDSGIKAYSRQEISDRIKDCKKYKRRCSDYQRFRPTNQGPLPTCWAAGTCHAFITRRAIQGLPLVFISPCSLAVPISGGHSGGNEGDAVDRLIKVGGADEKLWGPTDTSHKSNDSIIQQNVSYYRCVEAIELNGFAEFATALLQGMPCTVAYNWWSHVIMLADVMEPERDSFAFLGRNNWGDWGDKNDYGFSGYVTLREGHGTPSSGYAFREVYVSTDPSYSIAS